MGTKSGPNAHDTHLDVTIHHDTESFVALGGSSNKNALTSQLGQDSFIYKMNATTGKPISVYAMDTVPIDGNLYGNGTNGRWGGWSYIEALDSFDLAGETDMVAAIGMVRGRLTFPGTPDKQLTNDKNSCYDPWVAKINVATNQVVWATKENIDIPAPTDPRKDCDSAYPASVVTTAAGHVITSTDSRINRKYSNQLTKFNGTTGAFVWQKDFGQALYGERNAKMSSAGGEKVIYTGTFEGNASAGAAFFAPKTSTSSCEDGEKESAAIASFDVSATDAPVADWVVTMCGERRLDLLLVEVDLVVLRHVRARHVAGNHRRLVRARRRIGDVGVDRLGQAAHLRARDAEARVHVLERRLDRGEVGVASGDGGAARREQAELEVVAHHGGRRRVAVVHERQHGRGERRALRRVLRRRHVSPGLAVLVRVAERALHERHRHQADDLVDQRPHRRATAQLQPVATRGEQAAGLEQLAVDHRDAAGPARAEVGAPLLRQPVQQLAW